MTPATPARPGPLVMGIVNVTPDSFSDGGEWFDPERAVEHGVELADQGAAIVDVGGESTRPGAHRPSEEDELARVLPVVEGLSEQGVTVSVDTMRASVARAALEAGATMINDVSGGLADPQMPSVVAGTGTPFVAMHWRGHSTRMQSLAHYDDVVEDVCRELTERVEALVAEGVGEDQIILDPGIGFAKTAEHNWELLAGLDAVVALGLPVLLGTSRKGFLGSVGRTRGAERAPQQRDVATAVTTMHAALSGVWAVRVHDVVATVDALDVTTALAAAAGARR
ncbi:dihydropteroate synthase [Marihabitans asiaticum]|uniref:Dihydropteroate synthase n=1 Tax=Marihabitans asiaticum TaxID=415218 RepID=A0A560WDE7_9MICO|nr:dihydropteroate synthase [Marihabitans asiaticum]TWD15677.1 dihydropteroate synthase [Marihabitans asiaticum]